MIQLRDLRDDDVDRLYRWRREPAVDRWMFSGPPLEFEAHQRWFEQFRADEHRHGWVIERKDEPCGVMFLTKISNVHQHGQWGWYIGEASARGRGVGRAAQALGLDRVFSDFALQKVWSEVIADNDPALKALAATGFRREGYIRRHMFKGGQFHDVVLFGILAEEWQERRKSVMKDLQASGLVRPA